jgi:hypothetical protein
MRNSHTPAWIAQRAHHVPWLIEHEEGLRGWGFEVTPIDFYMIDSRIHFRPELAHHLPVYGHTPLDD